MAQFRTAADLKIEVLNKAGEPINGNSAYDSLAMTYLNKAQQAIVGGGSIFSVKVDEAFTWSRHKDPIILELQPAYITGSVVMNQGENTAAFTVAPTMQVEGWFLRVTGDRTIYKISKHTASQTAFVIDSNFIKPDGTYTFQVFKLDYEIFPAFINIDSTNDRFDFIETSATISVVLTHGSYTPTALAAYLQTAIQSASLNGNTYTISYDAVSKHFTMLSNLSAGGSVFKLLGATGTNRRRSILPSVGFDNLDYTGAATYTSTYIVGAISRLIEPFKIFSRHKDPFIYSSDPVRMQMDYPMHEVREHVPSRFARIEETNEGAVTIRFNSFPKEVVRTEVTWVEVPHDLQANDASIPIIPRKEIDVLIHAAASFIMFDKEDTKFADTLTLVEKQLQAMEKKNRSELFRTGHYFGQIVPREDKRYRHERRFRYGYTADE